MRDTDARTAAPDHDPDHYRATRAAQTIGRALARDDYAHPYRCPDCRRRHASSLDADLCCAIDLTDRDTLDRVARMLGRRLGGI